MSAAIQSCVLRLAAHAQLDAVVVGRHREVGPLLEQQRQLGRRPVAAVDAAKYKIFCDGLCVAMSSSSPVSVPACCAASPSPLGMPGRSTGIREDLGISVRSRFRVLPEPSCVRSDR